MSMSKERINRVLKILNEKVIGKVNEQSIPDEYFSTEEEMDKALQNALELVDSYQPTLSEKFTEIRLTIKLKHMKGFMLPGHFIDSVSPYLQALKDRVVDYGMLQPQLARSSRKHGETAIDFEDGEATVNEMLDFLEQSDFSWYPAKIHHLRGNSQLFVGLRHIDIDNYQSESLDIPDVQGISHLDIGNITVIDVARAERWIKVRIESEKPFPPIEEIGVQINQDKSDPNKLTLTFEKI